MKNDHMQMFGNPKKTGTHALKANWSGTIHILADESELETVMVEEKPLLPDIIHTPLLEV